MPNPTHERATVIAAVERILKTVNAGRDVIVIATVDEAAIAILTLIDTHQPNPDDPTSCGHCGMADGVDHLDGCPCGGSCSC